MNRSFRLLILLLPLCATGIGRDLEAADLIQFPLWQRQLFVDDYSVASISGLTKAMHQPVKQGAVIQPDQPWEKWLETRSAPAWDPARKIFKIWMFAISSTGYAGTTYAESTDGVHWNKPSLRQVEYQGSLENNFVTPDPTLQWPANLMENVVYDPHDLDPARRYKGFLGAEGRKPVVSPDGIHWSLLNAPTIPSMDESNLSYDAQSRTFVGTFKTWGASGREQEVRTSTDFVNWTTKSTFSADATDQVLAASNIAARQADPTLQQPVYQAGQAHADVYNMGVFRYEGLYVGMPSFYHATSGSEPYTDGFHLMQLTSSRDLQTWQRLGNRQTFVGPSRIGQGAFDLTQILPPSAPVVRDDELWFYYTGLKYRELPANPDPDQGAICLAKLRRDGFISLDAGPAAGTVMTKPFVFSGKALVVNANLAGGGFLTARVLGAAGQTLAISEPVVGDQVHAVMRWNSFDLAQLNGQTVSVEFTLRQGSLYSFWAVPEPTSTWVPDLAGDYHDSGNWANGIVPNGTGAVAQFHGGTTRPRSVYADIATTAGELSFDNANSYVLGGAGSLTIEVSSGSGSIHLAQGSHKINLPLFFASNTDVAVASGAVLTIADPMTIRAGKTVTKSGDVRIEAALTLEAGGVLNLGSGISSLGAMPSLGASAKINIIGEGVSVLKAALPTVTSQIKRGLENDGACDWQGPGIGSTRAASLNDAAGSRVYGLGVILNDSAQLGGSGPIYTRFNGQVVSADDVLVKLTHFGDADLSGAIDAADYLQIDSGYANGLSGWIHGDFDYSGAIDPTDYALIDNAYSHQSGALAEAIIARHAQLFGWDYLAALNAIQSGDAIPEPAAGAVFLVLFACGARRLSRTSRAARE